MHRNTVIYPHNIPVTDFNLKSGGIRVFIADDSPIVRVRLVNMISDINGITVTGVADNVSDAITQIELLRPDVVILDISMPGGSGIDVLKKVKQFKDGPCVIVLTNFPLPQYKNICFEEGADYFFDKSDEFMKVIELLKQRNSALK